ncbi:MAG: hypothetical protein WC449_05095 [Candidatus Paceibacterota bacterium]
MSINVKEARELVARCIETLDDNKTVEDGDVDTLCAIINQMCEHIENTKEHKLLTTEEQTIIEMLTDVWNLFLELPELHRSDTVEFMQGIHLLQNIILARIHLRYGKS